MSDDDLDDALTPYHLMHGCNMSKPAETIDLIPATNLEHCKPRLLHVRKVLRDCWTRFRSTYLNELRQMNLYWKSRSNNNRHTSVGDFVLIMASKQEYVVKITNYFFTAFSFLLVSKEGVGGWWGGLCEYERYENNVSEKAIKLNYLEICFGNVSLNYNLYFILYILVL